MQTIMSNIFPIELKKVCVSTIKLRKTICVYILNTSVPFRENLTCRMLMLIRRDSETLDDDFVIASFDSESWKTTQDTN